MISYKESGNREMTAGRKRFRIGESFKTLRKHSVWKLPAWLKTAGCIIILGTFLWLIFSGKKDNGYSNIIALAADSADTSIALSYVETMRTGEMAPEQEAPPDFTAWEEKRGETVTTTDKLKSAFDVSVISIRGSSENLIPYGKILWEDDKEGCLIGEKTAEALFGSHDVEGLIVCWEDRRFVIRGVLKEPGNMVLFQETEDDASFSRINFRCPENSKSHRTAAEKFKNRYGLSMVRTTSVRSAGVMGRLPSFEELLELVPGQWSDFDGWKRNLEAWKKECVKREGIPRSVFDEYKSYF